MGVLYAPLLTVMSCFILSLWRISVILKSSQSSLMSLSVSMSWVRWVWMDTFETFESLSLSLWLNSIILIFAVDLTVLVVALVIIHRRYIPHQTGQRRRDYIDLVTLTIGRERNDEHIAQRLCNLKSDLGGWYISSKACKASFFVCDKTLRNGHTTMRVPCAMDWLRWYSAQSHSHSSISLCPLPLSSAVGKASLTSSAPSRSGWESVSAGLRWHCPFYGTQIVTHSNRLCCPSWAPKVWRPPMRRTQRQCPIAWSVTGAHFGCDYSINSPPLTVDSFAVVYTGNSSYSL